MTDSGSPAPQFDREGSSAYWDQWNRDWRFRDRLDSFMQRQFEITVAVARAAKLEKARILGIGCGTGWLENGLQAFGHVTGTDLSAEAIAEGQKRYPGVDLRCCDFLSEDLPGAFDMVVSSDSLVPMADHAMCVRRVAQLLKPGGTFLLMTQNPRIWKRRSKIRNVSDSVPHAHPSTWPTLTRIKELFTADFTIDHVETVVPGGDEGLLWWVENEKVQSLMGSLVTEYRWNRLLEKLSLGRELIIVARRR